MDGLTPWPAPTFGASCVFCCTAPLASAAASGEILVSVDAAALTELDVGSLALKGKTQPLDVLVLTGAAQV